MLQIIAADVVGGLITVALLKLKLPLVTMLVMASVIVVVWWAVRTTYRHQPRR